MNLPGSVKIFEFFRLGKIFEFVRLVKIFKFVRLSKIFEFFRLGKATTVADNESQHSALFKQISEMQPDSQQR